MVQTGSNRSSAEAPGGIQSLDAALRLLRAMSERSGPVSLSEIAGDCGMPLSKAHRYLASFLHAGLVEQAGKSGKYDLGRGALLLGLAALGRHDFVNRAAEALPDLCEVTGLTGLLAVWGSAGATVVRWERTASPAVTSMGLGTTLPLLNSATGRAFLAWAPHGPLEQSLERELRRAKKNPTLVPDLRPTRSGVQELNESIRHKGYASVDGQFIPGLVAVSVPILDWQREAQVVVTLVGTDPMSIEPGSDIVHRLKAFSAEQSLTPAS